jgi:hypothetical protein
MDSIEELGRRWETIFQTLVWGTRRQIVGSLLEAPPDEEQSLPEAANPPDNRIDPSTLYSNLVHNHLPMMEKAGFIEWEETPFCVRRGPRFEEVAAVIMAIDTYEEFPQHLIEGCHFYDQEVMDS